MIEVNVLKNLEKMMANDGARPIADDFFRMNALNRPLPLKLSPEQRLNQYVELAAVYFDVPLALFSLITMDRQWIVASHGITLG